jgi:hypothetical protein
MDLSGPGIDVKLKERKKEDPRDPGYLSNCCRFGYGYPLIAWP